MKTRFDMPEQEPVHSLLPEIQIARSAMEGTSLVRDRTSIADRELTSLCSRYFDVSEPEWAIIALGGYGRMDLCPHSDLDILLLVEKHTPYREIRSVLEEVLYPLWDVGFHASYSVRTIRQAVSDARKDFFFRTSLFDARHIWGSEECLNTLRDALVHDRVLSNGKKFFQNLIFHTRKRHEKYGDTAYILEPDLKEGLGGLRDYHSILWGRKVLEEQNLSGSLDHILHEMDTSQLCLAVDSILQIRYALHEISGRKNDRVYIEYQDPLAQALGFVDNGVESPGELLMRTYHRSALVIKTLSELLLSTAEHSLGLSSMGKNRVVDGHFTIISGQLTVTSRDDLELNPFLMVQLFKHITLQNAILSPSARVMLKNTPGLVEMARHDPRAKVCFLSLLRLRDSKKSLTSMLELGVLERFIPEFSFIKGRTQPDPYHTYTTDLHSINTVAELTSLELEEKELFRKIGDPDVLYLSALLHDIGKGFGRPHADTGAPVACRIARQLDMTEDRAELVEFLVRNHLLLANLAVKRDLSEERVAMECARCVGDAQRLTMLYLLTVADSRATGPRAWNQ
ncbi:MAG: HD domain-containing protein [Desulfomonilia bacterium]